MDNILIVYAIYIICTIGLTIWVARTLFKNGQIFLIDIFHGNQALADAVNNLLIVGFYLINIGFMFYTLTTYDSVQNAREVVNVLSIKLGKITLILGFMHFFNMYLFFRLRKRAINYRPGHSFPYTEGANEPKHY